MSLLACVKCQKVEEIPLTDEEYERIVAGELIQNVIPHIPADLREMMISGYCGKCFDKLFAD